MSTTRQIANLRRLAEFLESHAEKLTAFEQFHMDHFRARKGKRTEDGTYFDFGTEDSVQRMGNEIIDTLVIGCETSACAAGWAATLPGMELTDEDFDDFGCDWMAYIERMFGVVGRDYNYAFHPHPGVDPTDPVVAARRIRKVADRLEGEWTAAQT